MSTERAASLAQQIDDDERSARPLTTGGRWRYSKGDSVGAWTLYDEHWAIATMTVYDTTAYNYSERMPAFRHPGYIDPDAVGGHIIRHDPAHVLGRVAAVRDILARYHDALRQQQDRPDDPVLTGYLAAMSQVIDALASAHEDLPGHGNERSPA